MLNEGLSLSGNDLKSVTARRANITVVLVGRLRKASGCEESLGKRFSGAISWT